MKKKDARMRMLLRKKISLVSALWKNKDKREINGSTEGKQRLVQMVELSKVDKELKAISEK